MASGTARGAGRTGGGTPKPVDGAPESEPETGPSTPSGASTSSPSKAEAPQATEAQETPKPADPPNAERRTPLRRLGERVSVSGVTRALSEGYPSRSVALIQGALSGAGYDPGTFDGRGGPRTGAALRAFAADRSIELTGPDALAEVLDALGFDI